MIRPVPGIRGAAALGTLALSSGVALTATSGWLIVAASYRPPILTLLAAIVLVRAFGIARPALRYAERVRSHDAALGHLARAREETYRALVPLTPARLGRRARGDLLTGVVDDLDDLAYAQVRVVVPLVAMVATGLMAAALVALVLWPAALLVVSLVFFALVVGAASWWLESRSQRRILRARSDVGELVTLIATQHRDVAAIDAHRQLLPRLAAAQDELARGLRSQGRARGLGAGLMPLLTAGHAATAAVVVAPWISHGLPTPIAALIVLVPVALGDVVGVVPDAVGALARAQAADRRLRALTDQQPAVAGAEIPTEGDDDADPETSAPGSPATDRPTDSPAASPQAPDRTEPAGASVTLEKVTARWRPPTQVSRDRLPVGEESSVDLWPVSLDLPAGRTLVVTGPNGCGKSTLLAVLARHLDPWTGTYLSDGVDALSLRLDEARAVVAVVDDEPHIFATTVRENLRLAAPESTEEQWRDALVLAGLGHWPDALEEGFDTVLGAGARGVSGGERARLAIARAVLSRRRLVLLDEPVAHLDHPTAQAVMTDLAQATRGRTVVVVTHREVDLPQASRLELRFTRGD